MIGRRVSTLPAALAAALLVAACGAAPSPVPSPSPTPTPALSPLTAAELKYRIIDQLGRPSFCDPDFYPVGRDEQAAARERFPEIQADAETFAAILARLGIVEADPFTDAQQLAIYRDYKLLGAVQLAPDASGGRFEIRVAGPQGPEHDLLIAGTIGVGGTIEVGNRSDVGPLVCPICLARGTLIETPTGPVPVEGLRPGMAVWTLDEGGTRVAGTVLRVGGTPVGPDHRVVRLVLDDGREVSASPGHPLADGRRLGDLDAGDRVDGSVVVSATLESYDGGATFDLLPSGPTGAYFANGIPLGSTLRP